MHFIMKGCECKQRQTHFRITKQVLFNYSKLLHSKFYQPMFNL